MAKILALDTSSDYCSVALIENGRVNELKRQAPRQHTQLLLPMVDELLANHGLGLTQLDAIAFGRGPGSFTGLRICFATVQGLAYGAELPVIPVSTLQAMALAASQQLAASQGMILAPMLDARMGQVYWGLYNSDCQALMEDSLNNPEDCITKLKQQGQYLAIGPGWHYPAFADAQLTVASKEASGIEPWAGQIALLAERQAQQSWQDIRMVQPVYLRDEVSWEKRQRIRESKP